MNIIQREEKTMPDNKNCSLEKIDAVNQKTWSPPKLKHLTEISETAFNLNAGGDGAGFS
jgi:hypothetical protein